MRALSLKQPFAELVVSGRKKIELRKWRTGFRGEFFIHASKGVDEMAMKKFGFRLDDLSGGKIVGKARLVGVKKYENKKEFDKDRELHLADSSWGEYGFLLENAERVEEVECKGALGFWNYEETE